jgi:glycine hydroxymethyltransferase
MGADEMKEIASVFKLILSNTRQTKITKGKSAGEMSKARFKIDDTALAGARDRITCLLDRYALYPELDLEYLQKSFA